MNSGNEWKREIETDEGEKKSPLYEVQSAADRAAGSASAAATDSKRPGSVTSHFLAAYPR